jgi:magnesium chelatase subunit I
MSITAFENLISTAERRILISGDSTTSIRMSDFMGVITAINGKIELVYEGEQEGAEQISYHLITESIKTLFTDYFPKIEKLQKEDKIGPYDTILEWFFKDNELFLEDSLDDKSYQDTLSLIPGINEILDKHLKSCDTQDRYFMMEFLLWGLEANKKLNKYRSLEGFQFKDSLGSYINGL